MYKTVLKLAIVYSFSVLHILTAQTKDKGFFLFVLNIFRKGEQIGWL